MGMDRCPYEQWKELNDRQQVTLKKQNKALI